MVQTLRLGVALAAFGLVCALPAAARGERKPDPPPPTAPATQHSIPQRYLEAPPERRFAPAPPPRVEPDPLGRPRQVAPTTPRRTRGGYASIDDIYGDGVPVSRAFAYPSDGYSTIVRERTVVRPVYVTPYGYPSYHYSSHSRWNDCDDWRYGRSGWYSGYQHDPWGSRWNDPWCDRWGSNSGVSFTFGNSSRNCRPRRDDCDKKPRHNRCR